MSPAGCGDGGPGGPGGPGEGEGNGGQAPVDRTKFTSLLAETGGPGGPGKPWLDTLELEGPWIKMSWFQHPLQSQICS